MISGLAPLPRFFKPELQGKQNSSPNRRFSCSLISFASKAPSGVSQLKGKLTKHCVTTILRKISFPGVAKENSDSRAGEAREDRNNGAGGFPNTGFHAAQTAARRTGRGGMRRGGRRVHSGSTRSSSAPHPEPSGCQGRGKDCGEQLAWRPQRPAEAGRGQKLGEGRGCSASTDPAPARRRDTRAVSRRLPL